MAGTRRSTRQMTTAAPNYTEDDSLPYETEAPNRNGKKATRRKRAWDEDKATDCEASSPSKKAAKTASSNTQPTEKPFTEAAKTSFGKHPKPTNTTTTTTPFAPPKPPPPYSPTDTNRDAHNHQQTFWLLKAEPLPRFERGINVSFSIDDLAACTSPEPWTGVRNPQARNNMLGMRRGDLGFFYHSNAKPSGIVGILRVVEEAVVDETAFDEGDPYYDAKSRKEEPKWWCVGVEFVRKFEEVVSLGKIKEEVGKGGVLEGLQLVRNGRLSVCKITREEWDFLLGLVGNQG